MGKDLNRTFTPTQHQNIIYLYLKSSICMRIQETNYKLLTRWYCTPTVLHRFFSEASDRCWRCREEQGTLFHIFWICTKIKRYWSEVHKISQKCTDFPIPEDPAFFLLHCSQMPRQKYRKSVLCLLVNAAKACISLHWKHPNHFPWLCGLIRLGISIQWKTWYLLPKTGGNNIPKDGYNGTNLYIQMRGSYSCKVALGIEVYWFLALMRAHGPSPLGGGFP